MGEKALFFMECTATQDEDSRKKKKAKIIL